MSRWLDITPQQGAGTQTIDVTANSPHTGRENRQVTLIISAVDVTPQHVVVCQSGNPAYVSAQDSARAESKGQEVTIIGTSNSRTLRYSLGVGNLNIALPDTYLANGATATNGEPISGDPGASAEYEYKITINVPANESEEELMREIVITDDNGNKVVCILMQDEYGVHSCFGSGVWLNDEIWDNNDIWINE